MQVFYQNQYFESSLIKMNYVFTKSYFHHPALSKSLDDLKRIWISRRYRLKFGSSCKSPVFDKSADSSDALILVQMLQDVASTVWVGELLGVASIVWVEELLG